MWTPTKYVPVVQVEELKCEANKLQIGDRVRLGDFTLPVDDISLKSKVCACVVTLRGPNHLPWSLKVAPEQKFTVIREGIKRVTVQDAKHRGIYKFNGTLGRVLKPEGIDGRPVLADIDALTVFRVLPCNGTLEEWTLDLPL